MSVSIVSRAAWGAKPWNGTPEYVAASRRTEFFVHYDGARHITATGKSVPQAIDRQHIAQGWAGIGYNFVVDQAGTIFEGRGWVGQGAHCPGHNVSGLGVQIAIGGDQEPSAKALSSARALYDEACRRAGRTLAKKGHKDGLATLCPGGPLYAWVKAGMPAEGYSAGSKPVEDKPVTWDGKTFPGASAFVLGTSHAAVTLLGRRLVAHGFGRFYKVGPGPAFGEADRNATQAFQKAQGWTGSDADGYPGPSTWSRLMAAPAPTPTPVAKTVSLSNLLAAARKDPGATQGHTTHPADVRIVEAALRAEGLLSPKYASDGSFGSTSVAAYRKWQLKLYPGASTAPGGAADGMPGLDSLKKLGARHGFVVKA